MKHERVDTGCGGVEQRNRNTLDPSTHAAHPGSGSLRSCLVTIFVRGDRSDDCVAFWDQRSIGRSTGLRTRAD